MSTEKWLEKRSVSCFLRILLNGSLRLCVMFWPWVRSADSQPGPQHAGWYSCWLCLLLCPPFASLSFFHSWAYLGNDLRAYFVPPEWEIPEISYEMALGASLVYESHAWQGPVSKLTDARPRTLFTKVKGYKSFIISGHTSWAYRKCQNKRT